MPIYEYQCDKCGKVTEALRSMSEADQPCECESCGSKKTHRLQSEFAAGGAKAGSESSLPASGGCCGGGGCACHMN